MEQYIDKSTIVAEIEKLKSNLIYGACASQIEMETRCKEEAYNKILSFIDTLEVKDVQEEPVSEELEEAAKKIGQKYFPNENNIWARPNYEAMAAANAFKEGYHWKEEQCQKTIEFAEDHAYLAGQEKVIEKASEFIETYPHLLIN